MPFCLPFLFTLPPPHFNKHHSIADQDPAAGHLLHRLPDQRAEVRRPQQRGRGIQGRHPQEVEREVTGTETERTGGLQLVIMEPQPSSSHSKKKLVLI